LRNLRLYANSASYADPGFRSVLRNVLPTLFLVGQATEPGRPGSKAVNKGETTSTRDLRPSERRFLSAMQRLGHGRFESLRIQRGELVLEPPPTAVRSVKFGTPTSNMPEHPSSDFDLKQEVKKNAPWFGKAGDNSTVWDSPSPKFIMGGSDEEKYDHPTQKPVELMRRPLLNHTKRGESVYEPFLGSGTTLAAAEITERVCYGIELDPKYVDVVVKRWQSLTGGKATLEGDGRTFEEIAQERQQAAA
jgi:hypothetical protein